jgi:hypothetical protein
VSGAAPAGKLAVTGSTIFGAVPACCRIERTVTICYVGDCKLHVSSVTIQAQEPAMSAGYSAASFSATGVRS